MAPWYWVGSDVSVTALQVASTALITTAAPFAVLVEALEVDGWPVGACPGNVPRRVAGFEN
jgi:hypothetical protein